MNFAKMIITLTTIGIISGGVLAGVWKLAKPLIDQQRAKALKEAIFTVLPEAVSYNKVKKQGLTFYRGVDSKGRLVGIAFPASGSGYQGEIRLMVGANSKLTKVKGMEVLESIETPGLGAKIAGEKFKSQFRGLSPKPKIELVKGRKPEKPNQIQAITGATISSRAVIDAINNKLRRLKKVLQKTEEVK